MSSFGLLTLRLGVAGMLLIHGWEKLIKFSSLMETFPNPIGLGSPLTLAIAVFAELFCSVLVLAGLMTKLATIPPIVTMLVIIFVVKAHAPVSEIELPILYLVGFLTLFLTGAGRVSIDGIVHKQHSKK